MNYKTHEIYLLFNLCFYIDITFVFEFYIYNNNSIGIT